MIPKLINNTETDAKLTPKDMRKEIRFGELENMRE
jgi:hypothetical protein